LVVQRLWWSVVDEHVPSVDRHLEFQEFVTERGPAIRRALVGRYGLEIGVEAYSDAIEYAWAHWTRVAAMANPAGYLFRVGQSRSRRHRTRRAPMQFAPEHQFDTAEDPALHEALWKLPPAQRTAVLLVHGHQYSYRDAADLMAVSEPALRNYVHRGTARLRVLLHSKEALDEQR
jgi:DNA-directed RNA polymerase specialized sigma24 family protein